MIRLLRLSNSWSNRLTILLLLLLGDVNAEVCSDLPKLDIQQCGNYDFIAYGRIDSEFNCDEEVAEFTTLSVFKGDGKSSLSVYTSCLDGGLPISKGEYWILFGKLNNSQEVKLSICGHSRMQMPPGEVDYQEDLRGSSFNEDLKFLKENFSIKELGEKELKPKKYERVDPELVPVLLGVGLIFMVIGFFVMKKLK